MNIQLGISVNIISLIYTRIGNENMGMKPGQQHWLLIDWHMEQSSQDGMEGRVSQGLGPGHFSLFDLLFLLGNCLREIIIHIYMQVS